MRSKKRCLDFWDNLSGKEEAVDQKNNVVSSSRSNTQRKENEIRRADTLHARQTLETDRLRTRLKICLNFGKIYAGRRPGGVTMKTGRVLAAAPTYKEEKRNYKQSHTREISIGNRQAQRVIA